MLKVNKNFVRRIEGNIKIKEHEHCGIISIRYRQKNDLFDSKLQRLIGSTIPETNEDSFER